MSHTELTALMYAVLDGEATAEEQAALQQQLAADPAAQAEFARVRSLFERLGALPQPHPPEGLVAAVAAAAPKAGQLSSPSGVIDSKPARTARFAPAMPNPWRNFMTASSIFANRKTWVGAGVAVAAVVVVTQFSGYPKKEDLAGTVVPAQRYRADATTPQAIQLGDQTVAQLLQNDNFVRMVKDPQVRAMAMDPAFQAAARAMQDNPEAAKALMASTEAAKALMADTEAAKAVLHHAELNRALMQSVEAAKAMMADTEAAKAVMANAEMAKMMQANAAMAKMMSHTDAARIMQSNVDAARSMQAQVAAAKQLMANADMARFMASNASAAKYLASQNEAARIMASTEAAKLMSNAELSKRMQAHEASRSLLMNVEASRMLVQSTEAARLLMAHTEAARQLMSSTEAARLLQSNEASRQALYQSIDASKSAAK